MAQELVDLRDLQFVLHEMFDIGSLSKSKKYKSFNKKAVDMIVKEAKAFASKEILPLQKLGDEEGCKFEKGKVSLPESYLKMYKLFCDAGWVSINEDIEFGGQGMPKAISLIVMSIFSGADCGFGIYPGLTVGAGKLIEEYGTEELKKTYIEKLYTGKWAGTMLLTEPQAGSDLGEILTEATPNEDGSYSIVGEKIFISGGEHNLTENIIHATLARIKGAPKGSRGISLFLVPKYKVNKDGSLGEFNDVVCTGIEKKLGIKISATCSLSLGSKGKCQGFLLGEKNKGLAAMFKMMNEERLNVGVQGVGIASASFVNAVNYAKQRKQGRSLLKLEDPNAPLIPIIEHPDTRRNLMFMKAYVDGMRALLTYIGLCIDKVSVLEDAEKKARYQGMVDLLTPIIKAYCSDKAFEVCTYGIQVYGGYGFTKEFPQEQLLRDCKITSLYEGTNGLQAMDLLGRKLGANQGTTFINSIKEMDKILHIANDIPELTEMTLFVKGLIDKMARLAYKISAYSRSPKVLETFSFAYPFLEVLGDTAMGCMHLWRASVAHKALKNGKDLKKSEVAFYNGQIKTAEYFIFAILPITNGKMSAIDKLSASCIEMPEDGFLN